MAIRILRIMEYVYEDNARAEEDMARWQVPPIGTSCHGNMTIKSTIITDLNFNPDEQEQGRQT